MIKLKKLFVHVAFFKGYFVANLAHLIFSLDIICNAIALLTIVETGKGRNVLVSVSDCELLPGSEFLLNAVTFLQVSQ